MKRLSLIAAGVALAFGSMAQAGGPLLTRVQAAVKPLPKLTRPLVAPVVGVTAAALPALKAPALGSAALPGLASTQAKADSYYYYPRPDPGHGSDWLTYNTNTNLWFKQDFSPYFWNVVAVGLEFSTDLSNQVLAASAILNPGSCEGCGGNDPNAIVGRVQDYATTVLDFGVSRGAGIGTKIGPPPMPKRPEALGALTPTLVQINTTLFGPYGIP